MVKFQQLSVKNIFIVQMVVLLFFLAGCAVFQGPEPLFGLSKNVSSEKVSIVNVRRVRSGRANGVWVFREGVARAEFTTKNAVLLLPGAYNFKVLSLVAYDVVQKGDITVKKDRYLNYPLKVQAGKKYELRRIRSGITERLEAVEIP